jgi:ubiquinone/menaquinone biosynthesis C-methylase UbiE
MKDPPEINQKSDTSNDLDFTEHETCGTERHHHRGKSSESLLDKGAILSALGIGHGQTILDAGCGNGYMSKEFSRLVGSRGTVYALDPDEIGIAALREETEGTNIVAMVADITTTTDLPASTMDFIYLSTVFHGFLPVQIRGFEAEVQRLLAPRGRLAIVEIVKRETPFGPPLNIRFSPEELKHALGLALLATVDLGQYFYMQIFGNRPGALPHA